MRWFVSLLLLLTGAVSAAAPQTQTFTDDLGRTVTVPLHPQRIVSMHDLDITIPLIELGAPPIASHGRTRPDGSHYLRSSAQLTGVDFDNSDIRFIGTADIDLEAVAAATQAPFHPAALDDDVALVHAFHRAGENFLAA